MKIIDLFAGSRSISSVAQERGWETFATDAEPFDNINLVADVRNLSVRDFPFVPDVVWASPPCQGFSVAQIGNNWNKDNTPKTEKAVLAMQLVLKTKRLIADWYTLNPGLIWFMENPLGKLHKLDIVKDLPYHMITYCSYGDFRMKPTVIFTNCSWWQPRPRCFNGNTDCHHAPAPRGSTTGTQGMVNAYEKSKIPVELVNEILDSCQLTAK